MSPPRKLPELYELRAHFDGVLLSLDLTVGESVAPTLPVAFLADPSQWTVETKDLAEIDVANVAINDSVTVELDAFPDEEFKGTVTEIDPVGREYLGDMTYKVTITLDEADPRFLWNMTATVNIE
jgi:HlyD family secretion protein